MCISSFPNDFHNSMPNLKGRNIMPVDYLDISIALTKYLAPFTPYLIEGGKEFAGKAGEATWNKAQLLWKKIKSKFKDDPKINGAALILSDDPNDEDACFIFAKTVSEKLEKSHALVEELMEILGGKDSVQEILVEESSWAEKITQEISGQSGRQSLKVKNDSLAINIHQKIENKTVKD